MIDFQLEKRGITDKNVLEAMSKVERHLFVDPSLRNDAYADRPLPIGCGQTISQPYIVAAMTALAQVNKESLVLEVGTGSGYQAAILAELVKRVYTIEMIDGLAARSQRRLKDLNYTNVDVKAGDGYHGWPEEAPFDAIVVTAAADHVPPDLVSQLKVGGKLVIPVGDVADIQHLLLIEKREDGSVQERQIMPVRFVPLLGDH